MNQINFLCKNIWEVEWSGILFYSTQGEFGTEEFKINVEYIYPMNKGNATYTEFETNEDYIEFLMDNPQYLQYNKGLIHSHNNMSVFFSGTDNSEINDNSEFHNYYVSLIVNNKKDMCAKVAFRGKNQEEVQRTISFKGTNGKAQTMVTKLKVEKEVIFHYVCAITTEQEVLIDDIFSKRVNLIIENAFKKEQEKLKITTYPDKFKTGVQSNLVDFWEKNNVKETTSKSFTSEFTASLLALDRLNAKPLEQILRDLRKKFGSKPTEKNEVEVDIYTKMIAENYNDYYNDFYDDKTQEYIYDTLEEVCELLEEYSVGNWVADAIYSELITMLETIEENGTTIN